MLFERRKENLVTRMHGHKTEQLNLKNLIFISS